MNMELYEPLTVSGEPTRKTALIEISTHEGQTESGIQVPDVNIPGYHGDVVQVSPSTQEVVPGDHVYFDRYSGTEIPDKRYRIFNVNDLQAVEEE